MIKNLKFKVLFFAVLFICGTLITAQASFKNPPTPPEHYAGPAMTAHIVATFTGYETPEYTDDSVHIEIEAQQQGQSLFAENDYYPSDENPEALKQLFDAADKKNLNDTTLDYALSQQLGGGIININTVTKFNRYGNVVIADVILLYVVSSH
jgi:hypothetical protein